MRITIEIDDQTLKEVQSRTGERKKSPAIQSAIGEYLRQQRLRELLERVRSGKMDYSLSNDELEAMSEWDSYDDYR